MFYWILYGMICYWIIRLRREICSLIYDYYLIFKHLLFVIYYDKYTSKIVTKEQFDKLCLYVDIAYDYIIFSIREYFIKEFECGKLVEFNEHNMILYYYKADVRYSIIIPTGRRGPKDIQFI